jgi:hypothetical protein
MVPAIVGIVQWLVSPGGAPAEGACDQTGDNRARHRRCAGFARLVVQQPVNPGLHKAALPATHAGFGHAGPAHDLRRAAWF